MGVVFSGSTKGDSGVSGLITIGGSATLPATGSVTVTISSGSMSDGEVLYGTIKNIACWLSRSGSTYSLLRHLPSPSTTSIVSGDLFRTVDSTYSVLALALDFTCPTSGTVTVTTNFPASVVFPTDQTFDVSIAGIPGSLAKTSTANQWTFTPSLYPSSATVISAATSYFTITGAFQTNPLSIGSTEFRDEEYDDILWSAPVLNGRSPLYIRKDLTVVAPLIETNINLKPLGSPVLGASKLFSVALDSNGNRQIVSHDLTTNRTVFLTSQGENFLPQIVQASPERVGFVSTRNGSEEYYWMAADGTLQYKLISDSRIVAYGDSLAGSGGYTDSLPSTMSDRTIVNQGIGSQDIDSIAARSGAVPVTFNVTGAQIPASGSVGLDAGSIDIMYGTTSPLSIKIGGVQGALVRSSATTNPRTYTFTRSVAGAAVNVTNPVTIEVVGAEDLAQSVVIINDHGLFQHQAKIGQIQAMVDYLKPKIKHYLVMGHLYETAHVPGNANRTLVDNTNATLLSTFGDHFFDLNAILIQRQKDYYNASDARFIFPALTGTIAGGGSLSMPSSQNQIFDLEIPCLCPVSSGRGYTLGDGFRRDQIHFSTLTGNPEIAQIIRQQIELRGY